MELYSFIIGCGLLAVLYSLYASRQVLSASAGGEKKQNISGAIQEGVKAYLARQGRTIFIIGILIAAFLWWLLSLYSSIGFVVGAILSAVVGYFGISISVRANVTTTDTSQSGIAKTFDVAFKGGTVIGMLVVGFGLLGVSGYYFVLQSLGLAMRYIQEAMITLSFGASLISIFTRLGGGIFAKGVDVGAGSVGKIEAGIPENDPRNPAIIAHKVGDDVGGCAGMAADLFETYVVTIVATMVLASIFAASESAEALMMYPLVISGVCIIGSIIGTLFVKFDAKNNAIGALYKGLIVGIILSAVLIVVATSYLLGLEAPLAIGDKIIDGTQLLICVLTGLIITALLVWGAEYYTSTDCRPVKSVARASETGYAANIIQGLAVSMEACALPVVMISGAMIIAYTSAEFYGVALTTTAMLALAGIIVALDAAGGVAQSITRGYAIGSAGLAALSLFAVYTENLNYYFPDISSDFKLQNPYVVIGLFLGGLLPYLFSAMAMSAVGRVGGQLIQEVRCQLKGIKGILTGEARPEYGRAVDLLTKTALKEMILPSMLLVLAPIVLWGVVVLITEDRGAAFAALGAMLVGTTVTGFFVAIFMTSGGGVWGNTKRYIEDGNHGGKGSETHSAAITGGIVGEVCKGAAGSAVNPMIKITNIVALLLLAILALS